MAEAGRDVNKAAEYLKSGGLVAIPTETVYGLAANALNPEAVAGIFSAKKRPAFDPLIIHFGEIDKIKEYVIEFPKMAELLAGKFWPGPLTLVLPKNDKIPDIVTSGLPTVGVRMPRHSLTVELLKNLDFPIAAPSANLFGSVSPVMAEHVQSQLGDSVNYILDGGRCKIGLESTIVGFEEGQAVVYRKGGVAVEEIEALLGSVRVMDHSSSNPKAPGMLKSHYAPSKKLVIGDYNSIKKKYPNHKIGCLRFSELEKQCPEDWQVVLSEKEDLAEAAWHLFEAFRKLEKLEPEIFAVETVPDQGLGRAINDRLSRASAS